MGNNLTPYSNGIGSEFIYFLTLHFKFIKRERIDSDKSLNTNGGSLDPYDLHVSQCGKNSFKEIKFYKIHAIFN